MTPPELNYFRVTLESQLAEITNGHRDRESLTMSTAPDELDRIQQASEREFTIGNLERDSERKRGVRKALRRLENDEFGICVRCDEDISLKRLTALPWAACCIRCQEAVDAELSAGVPGTMADDIAA